MWLIFAAIIICQTGHIETNCTNCPNGCDNNGKCYMCPENCENCTYTNNRRLICDTCEGGYYGHQCKHNCSKNCKEGECDKVTGACSAGCVVGFRSHECDRNCSIGCRKNECKQGNGVCSHGCVAGYYGHECNEKCSIGCQDMECSGDNGMCSKGCIDGFYGPKCERPCSMGCQDSKCNQTNAVCSIRCVVGYHGPLCKKACSKACRLVACHRLNGTCMYGCVEGYSGEACHQCHNCTNEMAAPQHPSSVPEIIGLTVAGIIFVAAAIALILLVRRIHCQRTTSSRGVNSEHKNDKRTIRNPSYDASIHNDNTNACSDAKPDGADHVYAVVQEKFQQNQIGFIEMDKSVADSNVYDVTSPQRQPEIFQRYAMAGAVPTGDNTYSHISHVNNKGRFVDGKHREVENEYDHVAHDFGHQGNEGTYDVARNNKEQPSIKGTERLRTQNGQYHDYGKNDGDDTYSHTNHECARVTTSIYNTVSDGKVPQNLEIFKPAGNQHMKDT